MDTVKLIFEGVGRDKWNGNIDIPKSSSPDDIAEYAYREAKKHLANGILIDYFSLKNAKRRYPDTYYDGEINEGEIQSGYHIAGKFHVEPWEATHANG